jgi:hypothetical protein
VGRVHRRLNLIVYLNKDWREKWGGSIELHSDPWKPESDRSEKILPLFNRAVVFETSEHSWHGFEPVASSVPEGLSRKSFALYLYTKERPAEEIAPSHRTIYVPQFPPPDALADEAARDKFVRARANSLALLKDLYELEKRLQHEIQVRDDIIADHRANQRLPLAGFVRQKGTPQGFESNFLMGKRARFEFQALRDASRIKFTFSRLPFIEKQSVAIRIDGVEVVGPAKLKDRPLLAKTRIKAGESYSVKIDFATAVAPRDLGLSGDERALSCQLVEILVE